MSRLHRVAAALVTSGALVTNASAQSPSTTATRPTTRPTARTAPTAAIPVKPPVRRRSIVHHYPYPYPGFYVNDATAGFRNPGGTGRYLEYYPPGNQFQLDGGHDPVKVATFGGGGIPTRDQQIAAQQVGIQRYNSIQQHIDNYARPYFGYGLGVGFFGGFN